MLHPGAAPFADHTAVSSTNEVEPGSVSSYIIGKNGLVKQVDKTTSSGDDPAYLLVLDGEVIVPNVCTVSILSQ